MNRDNNLIRLLLLLLVALVSTLLMYCLPEQICGYKIKKVDLLSELRVKQEVNVMDSLRRQLLEDTVEVDSVYVRDSIEIHEDLDSAVLQLRDSLYNVLVQTEGADSLGVNIEDYSLGHVGLRRFFSALNSRDTMSRPVRVAFLGDSFVEGDILVGDLRSYLQQTFGGRGVGFVPTSSVAAQYRPTIKMKSEKWKTWSMMTDYTQAYTLSGMLFEPEEEGASMKLETSDRYPEIKSAGTFKLYYQKNNGTVMRLAKNGETDTLETVLPQTDKITCFEQKGEFSSVDCSFRNVDGGFLALGVAIEDNKGVVVDNYSLRGNSGLILNRVDSMQSVALNKVRPYDLIILQYGLNVANDSVLQYGWYGKKMEIAIRHLRRCYPTADVLVLGVSDRGRQFDGKFETMPSVLALLHSQRQMAKRMGVTFWNVFGAMGGENSMVRYVENNWASKDYTHLSFRGGKELARILYEALMREKKFYDEADEAGF